MHRREFLKKCTAVAAGGFVLSNQALEVRMGAMKPNVIYIMADDLGYGDVGCYGQVKIETPNIDKLAAEGMRFTDHYSGSTVCAPTRCILMTGKHSGHSYVRDNYPYNSYQLPIPDETFTVAEMFKQAGYTTGCVGKWGLGGPGTEGLPNDQGFDFFYGYLGQGQAHNYYPDHLWRNQEQIYLGGQYYSHDLMTEEALWFINEKKERPFFLYVPYTIPHTEFQVPDLGIYADKPWTTDQKTQAAMITRMDRDIGRIIDLLKDLGLDDNTVVFFTSDNGPHGSGGTLDFFDANGPFQGKKRSFYDGGIRVPKVARWPGKIKPDTVTDLISAHWDFFPTCCDLVGQKVPADIDGISLLPTLLGLPNQQQHEYLYWEIRRPDNGKQAVRMGKWKGIRRDLLNNSDPHLYLYNLDTDIGESNDISGSHPDIVSRIEQIMTDAHTHSSNFPLLYGE